MIEIEGPAVASFKWGEGHEEEVVTYRTVALATCHSPIALTRVMAGTLALIRAAAEKNGSIIFWRKYPGLYTDQECAGKYRINFRIAVYPDLDEEFWGTIPVKKECENVSYIEEETDE